MFFDLFRKLLKQVYSSNRVIEDVVFSSFLERTNFYIPKTDVDKKFIYARKALSSILFVIKNKKNSSTQIPFQTIHLHNSEPGRITWLNFLNANFDGLQLSYSLRDFPHNFSFIQKLKLVIVILISVPLYYLLILKNSKAKQNLIALPEFIVNIQSVCELIKSNKTVYYTGIYEPESNLFSYYLLKKNNKILFFVSGTPLTKYLTKIYCSLLYVSNAYQKEEANYFSSTIIAGETKLLLPFSSKELVYNTGYSTKNVVAFHTSGIWKRKELGIYFDKEIEQKENKILNFLEKYIYEKNKELSVLIFMHPIEKKTSEDFIKAKEIYLKNISNKAFFHFADKEISTIKSFDKADLAVTSISNTLFERLFAGYKTIIVNNENDWFPIKKSSLNNITSYSYDSFDALITKVLTDNTKTFFSFNDLKEYLSIELRNKI